MSKKYNYIIARFWDEDECPTEKERLCIYTRHNREVHFGTEEEAFEMAKYISEKKEREYKPYFIDLNQSLVMNEETKIWVISVDEDPMPWEYWDFPHSVFTGTDEEAESYRLGLEANNPKEWLWSMVSTQVNTIQSDGKAIL